MPVCHKGRDRGANSELKRALSGLLRLRVRGGRRVRLGKRDRCGTPSSDGSGHASGSCGAAAHAAATAGTVPTARSRVLHLQPGVHGPSA